MEDKLPKSFQIEEINRLNGFFTLYAVPWALIGLINIEIKSRQLTGFLFAFAFIVNLLLFVYFSNQLNKEPNNLETDLPQALLIKRTTQSLNRIYLILGVITALLLIIFILLLHRPVLLTPLFLIITGFLFITQRWYYQIEQERWVGPVFFILALVLIILGNQFINWFSWGGFSGSTIIWYVCLDRHMRVHNWLQEQEKEAPSLPPQPTDDEKDPLE